MGHPGFWWVGKHVSQAASLQSGLGGSGSRHWDAEGGCGGRDAWNESDERAEDEDGEAGPDPSDERIEKRLDDGLVGVRVGALVDDVEVPLGLSLIHI